MILYTPAKFKSEHGSVTRPLTGTVATLSCPSSYFILNAPGFDSGHFESVNAGAGCVSVLLLILTLEVRTISQHQGEIFIFIKMMCDIFSSFHRCAGAGLRLAADTDSEIDKHLGEIFSFINIMYDIFSSFHRCAGAGLRLAADTVSDS